MRPEMRFGLSAIEKREIWRRWKAGQSLHAIGRAFDKPHSCIRAVSLPRGGIPPVARRRSRLALTLAEREGISEGLLLGRRFARSLVGWVEQLRQYVGKSCAMVAARLIVPTMRIARRGFRRAGRFGEDSGQTGRFRGCPTLSFS